MQESLYTFPVQNNAFWKGGLNREAWKAVGSKKEFNLHFRKLVKMLIIVNDSSVLQLMLILNHFQKKNKSTARLE